MEVYTSMEYKHSSCEFMHIYGLTRVILPKKLNFKIKIILCFNPSFNQFIKINLIKIGPIDFMWKHDKRQTIIVIIHLKFTQYILLHFVYE